jgi:hypothetical protein
MRRILAGSLIFSALIALPVVADAMAVMLPQHPGPNRVALTDAVAVGRVMGLEDVDVKVPVTPGAAQMTTYRIAVVAVSEMVRGKKEVKQVRVGFVPPAAPGAAIGPRPTISLNSQVQLAAGQEGLFYLQKHPTEDFFTVAGRFDFVSNQDKANYEKELKEASRAAKLLDNPMEGLKSKDAKDRYLTAALLITLHRTARVTPNKQEAISVEESKLILEALAESDNWKGQIGKVGPNPKGGPGIRPGVIRFDPMAPQQLFNMLGVTQQDGFTPPAKISSPDDYPNACREWCRKNAGTYQIKRFVSAK